MKNNCRWYGYMWNRNYLFILFYQLYSSFIDSIIMHKNKKAIEYVIIMHKNKKATEHVIEIIYL